jgi:hypothetical protein
VPVTQYRVTNLKTGEERVVKAVGEGEDELIEVLGKCLCVGPCKCLIEDYEECANGWPSRGELGWGHGEAVEVDE